MSPTPSPSIIADRARATDGQRRVDWARAHMPIVRGLGERFARSRSFERLRIGICLHVEAKSGVWIEALLAGGAEVFITGSPGTTQDETAAALASLDRCYVYATAKETFEEHLGHCARVLDARPQLIVDNGGDLHFLMYHEPRYRALIEALIGATEETTSGATRLREELDCRDFPTLVINDTRAKRIVENRYGVGSSVVDALMRATNVMLHGKRAVVVGYGYCGSGVAQRLRGMGARVTVVEEDPVTRLEAHLEGFHTAELAESLPSAEIVLTVTGRASVLGTELLPHLRHRAILANAGHFATEIDVEGLERLAESTRDIRPGIQEYVFSNGKAVYLLEQGNLVNLAAGDGNPIEIMDLGLALQALSLEYLVQKGADLAPGPQTVPYEVERFVAQSAVERWISE